MAAQWAVIAFAYLAATIAVPYNYGHRFNDAGFIGSVLVFIGIPILAGITQRRPHLPIALVATGLILLCPIVYAVTDPLAKEFERVRDVYFLGTFSTTVFVSTNWLNRGASLLQTAAATIVLSLGAVGVFILLGLATYLE